MRQNKMSFYDVLKIVLACIVAFGIGLSIAIPTIINLDFKLSVIDYLNSH